MTTRRATLPGAGAFFEPTVRPAPGEAGPTEPKRPCKTTVYFTPKEVTDIDAACLGLRQQHGIKVDRGRLLRVAYLVAMRTPDELAKAILRGDGA